MAATVMPVSSGITSTSEGSLSSAAPPKAKRYAFSQQTNEDCHLRAWVNHCILTAMRKRSPDGKVHFKDGDFLTRRQWFGENFSEIAAWMEGIQALSKTPGSATKAFMDAAATEAPVMPKFFTASRKAYISDSWSPLEKIKRQGMTPFFLVDVAMAEVSPTFLVPMSRQPDGSFVAYYLDSHSYKKIECKMELSPYGKGYQHISSITSATEGQKAALGGDLSRHVYAYDVKLDKPVLGFERLICNGSMVNPVTDPEGKIYLPYMAGLYQLMLLTMGLDHNNDPIEEGHPQYALHQELKKAFQGNPKSPWALPSFTKENFMEWHCAEILRKDPKLRAQLEERVDIMLDGWKHYCRLPELYDSPDKSTRKQYKDKNWQRFLPGREQMLAYLLSMNLHLLWMAGESYTAFTQFIQLPSVVRRLPIGPSPKGFIKAAYAKKGGQSFMDVWATIRTRLQERMGKEKQDIVCFSGHGYLMTFDPDLRAAQLSQDVAHPGVLADLCFAAIDSSEGASTPTFYRR